MTFTITKVKLAIAILVVAVLAPATAFAVHSWPDVDDGRFYRRRSRMGEGKRHDNRLQRRHRLLPRRPRDPR